jgi:hypothetical protein
VADKTYKVVIGIDFPPLQRREAGETVKESELPKGSSKWLVADGCITPAKTKKEDE